MSRIDQALRQWEVTKGTGTAEATATQPDVSGPLADYPAEASSVQAPEEPADPPIFEAARAPGRADERGSHRGAALLGDADIRARLVTGASRSMSVEQYRRLAAVLHEEQVRGNLKTVMITSALPGEGKTLTVANLALTLSGSYGRRVLVIDADLRAPSLHRVLALRNQRGLGDALRDGRHELPIVKVSNELSVMTAGRPGPSPLADLTSERMGDVIRECAASFDWVLIDTPPVGLLSDAQVLARLAGAVVFVIAAGRTPSDAVVRAISEIGTDAIIGTVLNRVEDRRIPEAYYYGDHYDE